ncbi:hypothetical protein Tco_0649034 [Tanacetum coccineum]
MSTSKDSSKGKSLTTSSKSGKSPNNEVVPNNDWYKKSVSDTSPDPEWNEGKLVDDGPEQRPVYNLLKGTCKSYVELDYTMEECYHALSEQLDWNNPKGHLCHYNLTKSLRVQMSSQASTTKSKAARYELKSIEDMVPNLWSLHDVYSIKRANQKLYTFKEGDFKRLHLNDIEDMVHLAVNLCMFARRVVIQARVEDLQLEVESYQKKLNLTKPRTQDVDMSRRPTDSTLISVHDTLDQMLHELHLGYNTAMRRRLWTRLDQHRTCIMIKAINQKLLDRRIMMSLENLSTLDLQVVFRIGSMKEKGIRSSRYSMYYMIRRSRYVIVQRSSRQKGFELCDDVVSFVHGSDANATKNN